MRDLVPLAVFLAIAVLAALVPLREFANLTVALLMAGAGFVLLLMDD